jgi:hypothetical protein
MGTEELQQLVEMYPDFLVDALVAYLERVRPDGPAAGWLATVDVQVSITGGTAVPLSALPTVIAAVDSRLALRVGTAQSRTESAQVAQLDALLPR